MPSKTIYIPYTYLIGWSKHNIWYYGCEYGENTKTANPSNLWSIYFTSSKKVKNFRNEYGEPDIIQIRKIFKTKEKTVLWESKVLTRMNVIHKHNWLNATNNKAIINSKESLRIIAYKTSKKLKGKPKPKESSEKRRETLRKKYENNPELEIEYKKKISINSKNRKQTQNEKDKRNESLKSLIWITNGESNKRINKNDLIPEFWYRGRTNKRTKKQMLQISSLGKIQGKRNRGKLIEGRNPSAKKVIFQGKEYYSIKNASDSTGISTYLVRKSAVFI